MLENEEEDYFEDCKWKFRIYHWRTLIYNFTTILKTQWEDWKLKIIFTNYRIEVTCTFLRSIVFIIGKIKFGNFKSVKYQMQYGAKVWIHFYCTCTLTLAYFRSYWITTRACNTLISFVRSENKHQFETVEKKGTKTRRTLLRNFSILPETPTHPSLN